VTAPLWPVDQQASADLLGQLHWHRARGADTASAMQAARRRLQAAPQYGHPYWWAGFTVVAGPSVVPRQR
jgi:CHAT domain-containing protein